MPQPRRRALRVAASSVAALALLSACVQSPGKGSAAGTPTTQAGTASFAPVHLDNCGFPVTIRTPPQRVLTIKSTSTELLLALGLADRIIGTAFSDGPVPDRWAAEAARLPVVSDQVPGQEAVLALAPDLVYAGWESNLTADGAGDRARLADLGIATYVSPAACKEPGAMPDPLTFEDVFGEITQVGAMLGAPDAAAALVDEQRAALATITPSTAGHTALWYSSGTDTPYVGAGIGAPQLIMDTAGLTNVFADVHDTWTSVGWEDVVARDPDVIVLVDASWNTAEHKKELLAANPATAELTAVREHRYLVVPFAATEAGVRTVNAAADLVGRLDALDARG